jgi:predicted membrane protein
MAYKGASAPGTVFWFLAVAVALYMGLTLKSGAFSSTIDMRARPVLFWGLMSALATIAIALIAVGYYELTHYGRWRPSEAPLWRSGPSGFSRAHCSQARRRTS